jgi:flagellar basal body-associated protein FliL
MNLLMLILILLALIAAGAVFYVAWELSSEEPSGTATQQGEKQEPGDAKE